MEPTSTAPAKNTNGDCRGRVIHGSGDKFREAYLSDDGDGNYSIGHCYFNDCGESKAEMQMIVRAINKIKSYRWYDIQKDIEERQELNETLLGL